MNMLGVEKYTVNMLPFGVASFAPLYEVFSVGHGRGPVKSRSVCFTDQIGGCCVAATLATVDLS
jgi:hypothetical protein